MPIMQTKPQYEIAWIDVNYVFYILYTNQLYPKLNGSIFTDTIKIYFP